MATLIKIKRDTATNWSNNNPVLELGEPGWDTTNKKLKIGDGLLQWTNLDYFSPPTASTGVLGIVKVDGTSITINNGVISSTSATASSLTGTTLASNVVNSSLTTVGTLTNLTVTNTITGSITGNAGTVTALTQNQIIAGLGFTPVGIGTFSVSTASASAGGSLTYNSSTGLFTFTPAVVYTLPPATNSVLGGVLVPSVGTSGIVNAGGTINIATATTTQLGGVKVDGTTITISNGVITSTAPAGSAAASALTGTTIASNVVNSSLTSVGTLSSLTVSGTATANVFTSSNVGTPTLTSSSNLNLTATNAVVVTNGVFRLPTYSSTSGLTPTSGDLIYNSTTNTVQVWSGSAWGSLGGSYTLPAATTSVLGGVVVPAVATSGINNSSGTISLAQSTTTQLGGVKVDGTTITINNTTGVITANYTNYSLPIATTASLGGVIPDGSTVTINGAGVITANAVQIPFYPAITRLDVTVNGSTGYQFNNQYTGDNPTIYAISGTTIAFNLSTTGQPFIIQTSGGLNFNTGLIHVSTTGTVTTGSAAQNKISGILYWQIPAANAGAYKYVSGTSGVLTGTITVKNIASMA
jgi:hypothetical protein